MLLVGATAGALVDRYRQTTVMIGSNLLRAVVAAIPLAASLVWGLTLPALLVSAVSLAALRAIFEPALQTSIPRLVESREELQAINGLTDATVRLARLLGPFLAGLLSIFVPTIYLLTANVVGFLASAAAIALVRADLSRDEAPAEAGNAKTSMQRMLHGFETLRDYPSLRFILMVNTVTFAAWILAITVGIPLLISASVPSSDLSTVSIVLGAYGVGDFLSNIVVSARQPKRPWLFMFSGYFLMGCGIVILPLSVLNPPPFQIPAMAGLAFLAGLGGPAFFIHMMTFMQLSLTGVDLASVLRVRITVTAAATVFAGFIGPTVFQMLGPAVAVSLFGLMIALGAAAGLMRPIARASDIARRGAV
jgi:MFS family permease